MRILSWNVNGLRAIAGKGFQGFLRKHQPDVLCLQESRVLPEEIEPVWPRKYQAHWFPAQKKGYSGTVVLTTAKPLAVTRGVGEAEGDAEGRCLTLEFPEFFLVNVYVPNAKRELERLDYRVNVWEPAFRAHVSRLAERKPVVWCGDMNVAHAEIDLHAPKRNRRTHGFTDEERGAFTQLLAAGFTDVFRAREPGQGHYTWWSQLGNCRARNLGWRIDYFGVSQGFDQRVTRAFLLPEVLGSDHCPIGLELDA